MAKYIRGEWHSSPADFSPLFAYLRPWLEFFQQYKHWPSLADYQQYLDSAEIELCNVNGQKLKVVENNFDPQEFNEFYAPQIYLLGEVQTRDENWHDFFQLVSWQVFPQTKARINATHFPRAKERFEQNIKAGRSQMENMLSQFDETGIVIVSDNSELLDMVKAFRWKDLFWYNREKLAGHFDCFVFGHGLLEKAIKPYIGMTGKAILLNMDSGFFDLQVKQQMQCIDTELELLFKEQRLQSPLDLCPFPILGMPGYWENGQESFYDNQDYFRAGRKRFMNKAS